jgi:L-iditol 2-dehydrogenase
MVDTVPTADFDPYAPLLAPSLAASSPAPCPPLASPNHAAVLMRKGCLQIQQLPLPSAIPAGFLLIAIRAVGICGSDVHHWTHGGVGSFIVKSPMVSGHESAGEVIALGPGVSSHKPGDRVALEPGISCRLCSACSSGHYNLCASMRMFGSPPNHGALRRYVLHPAALCFLLPAHLSFAQGAFCEPLAVAVMAVTRAELRPGMKVAVMGAGPIGLVVTLAARAWGVSSVLVTDVDERRLQKAKEVGAEQTVAVDGLSVQEVVAVCTAAISGQADVAFDCVGVASATNAALGLTRSGGLLMRIGLAEREQLIDASAMIIREVTVKGIFRYCHVYPTCIELLSKGKVDVTPLITHPMQLAVGEGESWRMDESVLVEGFETARTRKDGAIKVMFHL